MSELVRKVKAYIRQEDLIRPGERVLAGVSGGADSTALFLVLHALEEELSFATGVMHVEHGIRGSEAREDAEFVEQLCMERGTPFFLRRFDVPAFAREKKLTEEEAGRVLRYRAFEECAQQEHYDRIAVAHQENDNAETMLFQLLRGSGPAGAGGIPPKRGRIIRPLLCVQRSEIEQFLQESGVSWRMDSTNQETKYSRNKIRREVLPLLETIQPQAVSHLARSAGYFRQADQYLSRQAQAEEEKIIHRQGSGLVLNGEGFRQTEKALRPYILMDAMEQVCGRRKDLTDQHLKMLESLFDLQSGSAADLPYGMKAVNEYGNVRLTGSQRSAVLENPAASFFLETTLFDRKSVPETAWKQEERYTKYVDYDKITENLSLRMPREEDYIVLDAQGHRKKLSRWFMDRKIPQEERRKILLAADGNHIVWIVGSRLSYDCRVTESTEHILKLEIRKEEQNNERAYLGND